MRFHLKRVVLVTLVIFIVFILIRSTMNFIITPKSKYEPAIYNVEISRELLKLQAVNVHQVMYNSTKLNSVRKAFNKNNVEMKEDQMTTTTTTSKIITTDTILNHVDFQKKAPIFLKGLKKRIFNQVRKMFSLHERVYKTTSEMDVFEFYRKEKDIAELFKTTLDLHKDRKLLASLFPRSLEMNDRVSKQLHLKLNTSDIKTILMWDYEGKDQTRKLATDNCNIKTCKIIYDEHKVPIADAIVIPSDIDEQVSFKNIRDNQVVIWQELESAQNVPDVPHKINWTATYRSDSVVNTPYFKFTPYQNVTNLPVNPMRNFAKGKSKLVAWFVSNCYTWNNRDRYVKELQKYISVDIYGTCGNLKCSKENEDCFKMLKNDYKFYLSFENSNCRDYITEKISRNAYENDVVPIVMGAHLDDYIRLVPPRSFIHVEQFESPKELATYLQFLNINDDLYNSYFLWKNTGYFMNTKFLCRLCAMVHLAPLFPMSYKNPNEWWNGEDKCVKYDDSEVYSSWE